jgi:hypothetical protein
MNRHRAVTDPILDADPKMAAWLRGKDDSILLNSGETELYMDRIVSSDRAGFDLEVDCFDRHAV